MVLFRPRVPLVSEKDTPRHTLLAEDVARYHSTDRSTPALLADILLLRPEAVSNVDFIIDYFSYPTFLVEWGQKAKRRRTTGTGRMSYLKTVNRRFKNGFREGW